MIRRIYSDYFFIIVCLMIVLGLFKILVFSYYIPFGLIFASILYKAHCHNVGKEGEKGLIMFFILSFVVLFSFRIYLFWHNIDSRPNLKNIYLSLAHILSGFSLLLFPALMLRNYKEIFNVYSNRELFLSQLAIISLVSGLVQILMVLELHYSIDFDISLASFDYSLVYFGMFLIGNFIFLEIRQFEEGSKEAFLLRGDVLSKEEEQKYKEVLKQVVKEESLYLRIDFSLDMLSDHTGIPKYKLSQYFSQLHMSFYEYFAEYKIRYALKSMDKQIRGHTIAAMAYECGFSSVTTFNKYFKKYVGCSPREYRERKLSL